MRIFLLSLTLALATACLPPAGCDDSARSSVTVSIVDASGALYAPERVTYAVDDSDETDCEDLGDGTEFVCGWEETGRFTIRVYEGENSVSESTSVTLTEDGCHVESVFLEVLAPSFRS